MIVVQIYIDDILVTDSNVQLIKNVIHHLSYQFALKDLAEFNYFFCLEVTPSIEGMHLSQTKYTGDILKGCQTPMSSLERLVNDKGVAFENPSLCKSIIGSLQYLTLTRLEIAFTVNNLANCL